MSRTAIDRLLIIGGVFLLWQALHLWAGSLAMPSPWGTVLTAVRLIANDGFARHALASLEALALAFAIAAAGGIGLGVWLGASRVAGAVAEPILTALYALPKVTLYPMILLIFGLGLSAKVAFGAIHGIMPITLFVMTGVRNIPAVYLKAAHSLRMSPAQAALHVLLPAALPELLSGLRVGLSLTLLGTLIGEMFASREGLGYLLMQGIALVEGERILAITLILFVAAVSLNMLLHRFERRARGRFRADAVV